MEKQFYESVVELTGTLLNKVEHNKENITKLIYENELEDISKKEIESMTVMKKISNINAANIS